MSTSTESTLLSLLSADLRHHLRHTMTQALHQKKRYLTDCSDEIFYVPKCSKIQIFRGFAPDPTVGSSPGELTLLPYIDLPGGEGNRCHSRSRPFDQASLLPVQGQTHYKVVNRKYDYYTINTQ